MSSSVSLLPGTLIRFGEGAVTHGVEGVAPNPSVGGAEAGITEPAGSRPRGTASSRAPRGSGTVPTKPAQPPPAPGSAPF